MHHENLKFIGSEQTMENKQSRVKIVLHSFSVGDEAYFMKQWLSKHVNLIMQEIKNCIRDLEEKQLWQTSMSTSSS